MIFRADPKPVGIKPAVKYNFLVGIKPFLYQISIA